MVYRMFVQHDQLMLYVLFVLLLCLLNERKQERKQEDRRSEI
jgi:hypothetical protein